MDGNQVDDSRFEIEETPVQTSSLTGLEDQNLQESVRHQFKQKIATPATALVSGGLGFLGDIASIIHDYGVAPVVEAATGEKAPSYENILFSKAFPTSEMVHGGIEQITGQKLRPETAGENILTTAAGFLGAMGRPGGAGKAFGKTIPPMLKNVISSFIPASVKVGAEEADLPPGAVAGATVASALLGHKLVNKSFKDIYQDLYKKSDALAENVMLDSGTLERELKNLSADLSKGLTTPPKAAIRKTINEIEGKISGGAYKLSDLTKWRTDTFELSKEFTKDQLKGSEREWKALRGALDNVINEYAETNPEWGKTYREANALYRGLNETKAIEKWLTRHPAFASGGLAGELTALAINHTLGLVVPTGIAAAKLTEFTVALARNAALRRATSDFFKNAAKEDVKGTVSSLKKMNENLEDMGFEEDQSDRFEIED